IGTWAFRPTARAVTLIAIASPFGLIGTLLLVVGDAFLKIDVRAGTARLVQFRQVKWSMTLDALGALSVRPRGRRFAVVAQGTDSVLFTAADRGTASTRMHLI